MLSLVERLTGCEMLRKSNEEMRLCDMTQWTIQNMLLPDGDFSCEKASYLVYLCLD